MIWDLNSPYISWFLIAAALRPKARRQPCWAGWSLPHLMGNPVGETPTEVEWHDSHSQQNKRVEIHPLVVNLYLYNQHYIKYYFAKSKYFTGQGGTGKSTLDCFVRLLTHELYQHSVQWMTGWHCTAVSCFVLNECQLPLAWQWLHTQLTLGFMTDLGMKGFSALWGNLINCC